MQDEEDCSTEAFRGCNASDCGQAEVKVSCEPQRRTLHCGICRYEWGDLSYMGQPVARDQLRPPQDLILNSSSSSSAPW